MNPDDTPSRRGLIEGLATAGVAATLLGLGGCLEGFRDDEPDPLVVRTHSDSPLDAVPPGEEVTVYVLVHNVGTAGEIVITVELVDDELTVIESAERRVEMDGDDQREFSISMTVPATVRSIQAEARAGSDS